MTYFGQFPDDPYYQTDAEEAMQIEKDLREQLRESRALIAELKMLLESARPHVGVLLAEEIDAALAKADKVAL